jgi:hypothetical protein
MVSYSKGGDGWEMEMIEYVIGTNAQEAEETKV